MKKTILIIVLIVFCALSATAQNKTVTWDGTTYQVVTQARDFLLAYKDSKPAALLFKINDYQKTMFSIRDESARLDIDMTQAFDPTVIVKASNLELYTIMEAFTLVQGGNVTPNVDAYVFNKVKQASGNVSRAESANNLKVYFKYLAGLWWPRLNESQKNSRMCDSCYKSISYGNGFAYGYYSNGNLSVWRLWCDDCMEKRLEDYRKDGLVNLANGSGFFDAADVYRANEYAKERR